MLFSFCYKAAGVLFDPFQCIQLPCSSSCWNLKGPSAMSVLSVSCPGWRSQPAPKMQESKDADLIWSTNKSRDRKELTESAGLGRNFSTFHMQGVSRERKGQPTDCYFTVWMVQIPGFEHYWNCAMYIFNTGFLTWPNEAKKLLHEGNGCLIWLLEKLRGHPWSVRNK